MKLVNLVVLNQSTYLIRMSDIWYPSKLIWNSEIIKNLSLNGVLKVGQKYIWIDGNKFKSNE